VQHLDDLDDILAAVRRLEPPIDRRAFRAAITEALGSARAMSQSNVDFLYHIFDRCGVVWACVCCALWACVWSGRVCCDV
jgi:hypothetical protein